MNVSRRAAAQLRDEQDRDFKEALEADRRRVILHGSMAAWQHAAAAAQSMAA